MGTQYLQEYEEMSLFTKILAARDAINYGEKLANSETWKKQAIAVSAIAGLLSAALPFIPNLEGVTDATVNQIAAGVYAVYSVYTMFVTAATSESVGLPTKRSKQ
jgi:hypothetical protein